MDPPPFGYTFEHEFGSPTAFTSGNPLLNQDESQQLLEFFSQDPFLDADPLSSATDAKADFNSWESFVPPTVHQVSTTIADQSQLHRAFPDNRTFAPDALSASHFTNTHDDIQAASTLFGAQTSHMNGRSYSVPSVPTMQGFPMASPNATGLPDGFSHIPLVPAPHGMLNEQLAALIPKHSENGSIDSQMAAQFSQLQAQGQHTTDLAHLERQRPHLKRSYTYGTDSAFNSSGYIPSSPNAEDAITQRLLHTLRAAQPIVQQAPPRANGNKSLSPTNQMAFPVGLVEIPSDNEAQSEEDTTDEDEDDERPTKKRRKGKNSAKVNRNSNSPRKSISTVRPAKNGKASIDEPASKRKRLSSAGHKVHRENLTEEQKRSNHILSEQKRRNLIKRGFDDLHDLVPEIRNGGLSKSSVLMEAANFLEKLIEDNNTYAKIVASGG